jgi:hypothetical protein
MEVARHIGDDLAAIIFHPALDEGPLDPCEKHAMRTDTIEDLVPQDRLSRDPGGFVIIELQVLDLACLRAISEGFEESRRLGHGHAHRQLAAGCDPRNGSLRCRQLGPVERREIHRRIPC